MSRAWAASPFGRGWIFDEEGRPYTQNDAIMLLRGIIPQLPVFDKPIYFDNPADLKAYLFRFLNKDGGNHRYAFPLCRSSGRSGIVRAAGCERPIQIQFRLAGVSR